MINNTMTELGFERLSFKYAVKFFETGKTPMYKSCAILPTIKPPNHMVRGTALPVFLELYKKYRNTKAK